MSALPGLVRLRRESVWTAWTPANLLSTYIVWSRGWSKPVWYLFATTRTWKASEPNFSGSSRSEMPSFIPGSVNFWSGMSSSTTSPENATSTPMSL